MLRAPPRSHSRPEPPASPAPWSSTLPERRRRSCGPGRSSGSSNSIPVAGLLAPGASYTGSLSGTNAAAFEDTDGNALAGDGGTAGTNYPIAFASPTSATADTVNAPYLARGFDQPVNIPANTNDGLPIGITVPGGGTPVTAAAFDVIYNPALLTVTGGAIVAGGFTGSVTVTAPGIAAVTLSGGTLAAGTTTTVADLNATVPTTAPYKDKEVLDIQDISLNGGAAPGQDGSAVHVAAFMGDATGDMTSYTSQDAFLINQVFLDPASGFANYKLLSPVIIGDTLNAGTVNSQDAFNVNQVAIGNTVPTIPACRRTASRSPVRPSPGTPSRSRRRRTSSARATR